VSEIKDSQRGYFCDECNASFFTQEGGSMVFVVKHAPLTLLLKKLLACLGTNNTQLHSKKGF